MRIEERGKMLPHNALGHTAYRNSASSLNSCGLQDCVPTLPELLMQCCYIQPYLSTLGLPSMVINNRII